jgi:hypothetical protein
MISVQMISVQIILIRASKFDVAAARVFGRPAYPVKLTKSDHRNPHKTESEPASPYSAVNRHKCLIFKIKPKVPANPMILVEQEKTPRVPESKHQFNEKSQIRHFISASKTKFIFVLNIRISFARRQGF